MKMKQVAATILIAGLLASCSVQTENISGIPSGSLASTSGSSAPASSQPPAPIVLQGPLVNQLDLSFSGDALLNEAGIYFTIPELDAYEKTELIAFEDGKLILRSGDYSRDDEKEENFSYIYSYDLYTDTLKNTMRNII